MQEEAYVATHTSMRSTKPQHRTYRTRALRHLGSARNDLLKVAESYPNGEPAASALATLRKAKESLARARRDLLRQQWTDLRASPTIDRDELLKLWKALRE